MYIADSGNSRLLHVDSGGILRVLAAALGLPTQLVVGADGALIFAEAQQHQFGRLPLRQLWPVPQARVFSGANYTVEIVAAVRQEGLQEVVFDAADQLYLTYRTGVDRIGLWGETLTSSKETAAVVAFCVSSHQVQCWWPGRRRSILVRLLWGRMRCIPSS